MDPELLFKKIQAEWDIDERNEDNIMNLYTDLINTRSEDFLVSMLINRAHLYYYYKNDFEKAMRDYNEALELSIKESDNEDIIDIYNKIGDIYFDLKNYEKAVAEYNNAKEKYNSLTKKELIKFSTPQYESYLKLGNLHLELGNYMEALNNYKLGEVNYTYEVDFYIGISLCYLKLNNPVLAFENFDKIIDDIFREQSSTIIKRDYYLKKYIKNYNMILNRPNASENFPLLFSRGAYYYILKEYDLAIKDFEALININQFFIPSYFFKGMSLFFQSKYNLFVKNYDRVNSFFPEYRDKYLINELKFAKAKKILLIEYFKLRGEGYSEIENKEKSILNYLISLDFFVDLLLEKNNLIFTESDNLKQIKLQYKNINNLAGNQLIISNNELEITEKLEMMIAKDLRLSEFEKDFEDYLNRFWKLKYFNLNLIDFCIKIFSYNPRIYLFRALKNLEQGKYQEALNDCKKASTLNPSMKESYNNAAIAYYKLENYQDALIQINLAFEKDINDSRIFYTRGLIFLKLNKFTQSILDFNMSLEIDQNVADVYFARARAYIYLDDKKNAIKDLDKAYSIDLNLKDSIDYLCEQENISFTYKQEETRSRNISTKVRDEVWNRAKGKCEECGSQINLEFDHIIPFSKGGSNTYRNIQLLCESCNRKKFNNIG